MFRTATDLFPLHLLATWLTIPYPLLSLTILQQQWLFHLAQGLCTCCTFCQEHPPLIATGLCRDLHSGLCSVSLA